MRSLSWEQVRRIRMDRAHLTDKIERSISAVAGDVGGIHAQVMSAAETSLGVRIEGLKASEIRTALWEERSIVKAWTLRGTLHLHPAEELPMWIAARAAVTPGIQNRTLDAHGLDSKKAAAITEAIGEALDGTCLLRKDLAETVAKKLGKWAQGPLMSGWGTLLGQATLQGWLCHGPPRGTSVTFVRADQWVESWSQQDPEEALRWVARRYIAQFGPVTHSSFHSWFNGPAFKVSQARAVFEQLGDEIEQVEVEGKRMWMLSGRSAKEKAPPVVRFLPLYDCYLTGFRERDHLLTAEALAFAKKHPKGRLEGPVAVQWLMIDGMVAGTWSRTSKGRHARIVATPFSRASRALKTALEQEAYELGSFWGVEVDISVNDS